MLLQWIFVGRNSGEEFLIILTKLLLNMTDWKSVRSEKKLEIENVRFFLFRCVRWFFSGGVSFVNI